VSCRAAWPATEPLVESAEAELVAAGFLQQRPLRWQQESFYFGGREDRLLRVQLQLFRSVLPRERRQSHGGQRRLPFVRLCGRAGITWTASTLPMVEMMRPLGYVATSKTRPTPWSRYGNQSLALWNTT